MVTGVYHIYLCNLQITEWHNYLNELAELTQHLGQGHRLVTPQRSSFSWLL